MAERPRLLFNAASLERVNSPCVQCDHYMIGGIVPLDCWLKSILLGYFLLFSQNAEASTAAETIKGYFHHTAWTLKDGAPQGIWAITQTPDGWLWLGGQFGLARFDGTQFEKIDLRPPQSNAKRGVSTVYASRSGDLWLGFIEGGVLELGQGKINAVSSFPGLRGVTQALSEDGDGRIWATTDTGMWVLEEGHWSNAGSEWGLPRLESVVDLALDAEASLWVGTATGFYVLPKGSRRFERTPEVLVKLATMGLSQDGAFWRRDQTGYTVIKQQNHSSNSSRAGLSQEAGNAEILVHDGRWWSVDCPRGICRTTADSLTGSQLLNKAGDDT